MTDEEEYLAIQKWLLTRDAYVTHHESLRTLIPSEKARVDEECRLLVEYLNSRRLTEGLACALLTIILTRTIQANSRAIVARRTSGRPLR